MHSPIVDNHIILLGHPPLGEFVQYLKTILPVDYTIDRGLVAQEWRAANSRLRELATTESQIADNVPLASLPDSVVTLLESHIDTLGVRHTLQITPYQWGLVPIDRLLVYQKHINLSFVADIAAGIPESPALHDLARLVAAEGPHRPPLNIRLVNDHTYTFSCASRDLRLLTPRLIEPPALPNVPCSGRPSAVLATFVGYGINFVNALLVSGRLVLINGTHRAYALRRVGITHMPCLIQLLSSEDELDILGIPDTKARVERYLRMPRPPLFKDYFDPTLHKLMPIPRTHVLLQIQMTSQYITVPAT